MYSRWYNVAVVVLWLLAMGWLMATKVVDLVGDPPSYRRILQAQREDPRVGWFLMCNDRELGWALTETEALPQELTEIKSVVCFDNLGALDSTLLLNAAVRHLLPPAARQKPVTITSAVRIDSLENLLEFDSALVHENLNLVRLRGSVESGGLKLRIFLTSIDPIEKTVPLPKGAIMGGVFSPQVQLGDGLRLRQRWKSPITNPLSPTEQPMEWLEAEVVASEPFSWESRMISAWRVEYRMDPGYGPVRDREPRGRMWVARDGTILRQDAKLLDATLSFTRMNRHALREHLERMNEPKGPTDSL